MDLIHFVLYALVHHLSDSQTSKSVYLAVHVKECLMILSVHWQVSHFLEKNKDTLRSDVVELLCESKNEVGAVPELYEKPKQIPAENPHKNNFKKLNKKKENFKKPNPLIKAHSTHVNRKKISI